jgi:hypothetical protein
LAGAAREHRFNTELLLRDAYKSVCRRPERRSDKEETCMFDFGDIRGLGKKPFDTISAATTSATKGLQAITSEAMDFSTKSFDNSRTFFEKLAQAKKPDELIELQSNFARAAYEDFLARASRINKLYSDLTTQAFRQLTQDVSEAATDVTEATKNVYETAKKAPEVARSGSRER